MKLKDGFITHNTEEEHILISTGADGFSGLVRSNATAAFIIERLKTETTVEALTSALMGEYRVDCDRARRGVEAVVAQLRAIGALEE